MYTKQQYAKKQPKDGDVCVHCGHFNQDKNLHFWIANGKFVRPDGSRGEYQWLVSCNRCFHQAKGKGELIQVRGDIKWKGQEPSVLKAANPYEKLFVADHMEARAGLHEYWTMIIDTKEVEAVAHQDDRPTYLVASDFRGLEPEAGIVQEGDC